MEFWNEKSIFNKIKKYSFFNPKLLVIMDLQLKNNIYKRK